MIDLRTREFFNELETLVASMANNQTITSRILYLEADEDALVSRYKETRRSHPLAKNGRLLEGIRKEKEILSEIRSRSQIIINTSDLTPRQLRQEIMDTFMTEEYTPFHVEVLSFGFKHGTPIDADIVMDVRFLPNPYYVEALRPQTGLDQAVYDYVMKQPETQTFYSKFIDLVEYCLPGYKKEGKASVTIAIGCTGGQHRSVAIAERLGMQLKNDQYAVNVAHRDARIKEK